MIFIYFFIPLFLAQTSQDDRVNWDFNQSYNYPYYSGYLNISSIKSFHYVYFTSQSDTNNDPLLIWLNGGPGCSSLIGMVYQNGPFLLQPNTSIFKPNKYSWNKNANLLYLQSPGNVGFSVGPLRNTDNSVKKDNLDALIIFFTKFPALRKNDLYLSGQSYAGIYVPYFALAIHQYNRLSSTYFKINLKGIIVGNACTDPWECYYPGTSGTSLFQYQFLYKHSYYTLNQYSRLKAACVLSYSSTECFEMRSILDNQFANTNTQLENIYAPCWNQASPKWRTKKLSQNRKIKQIVNQIDCSDSVGAINFWNNGLIRSLFHVQGGNPNFKWDLCNAQVQQFYISNQNASYWIYPILIKNNYRVWVYSGDIDANVPITGTINWIKKLRQQFNIPIEQPWREWWVKGKRPYEDQVGGMVWKLKGLTFVSVKNAGHLVPRDQPQAASLMLTTFLNGQDFIEE